MTLAEKLTKSAKKLNSPGLRFGKKVDAKVYTREDYITECNEEPTHDWQRRWNFGIILRHNARHQDPKPLPTWITESPNNYATMERPLPESKNDRKHVYDTDCRCDPWDEPNMYDDNSSHSKSPRMYRTRRNQKKNIRTAYNALASNKEAKTQPVAPVTVTSIPIDADDIICIEDKTLWSLQSKKQSSNTYSPPPAQTAPITQILTNDADTTNSPTLLPQGLDVIKEFN